MANNHGYQGGNYSTTTYGGGGGNDGGGFMNGSQQGSQDSPSKSATYGQETLRAVTIKQILDATPQPHSDANFKIDGIEVSQVTFIGQVNSISQKATNILYKVDDGTGITEIIQWLSNDADPSSVEPVAKEGEYVRVFGRLKSFANKRHVASMMLRPVPDFNEVNCHLLEATATHLYLTRGPPESADGAVKGEQGTSMFVDNYSGNNAGNNAAGAAPGRKLPPRMSAHAKKVYELLQSAPQSNEGLHVHNISSKLAIQPNDVFKAGDELLAEGLIYTTVDDETWAVLEY